MEKPKMILNMRISVDSCQQQRFTEEEVMSAFMNDNVEITRTLVIRKSDLSVMGQILTNKE